MPKLSIHFTAPPKPVMSDDDDRIDDDEADGEGDEPFADNARARRDGAAATGRMRALR